MASQHTDLPIAETYNDMTWYESKQEFCRLVREELERSEIYAVFTHVAYDKFPLHLLPLPRLTEDGHLTPETVEEWWTVQVQWDLDDQACKEIFLRHARRFPKLTIPEGHRWMSASDLIWELSYGGLIKRTEFWGNVVLLAATAGFMLLKLVTEP